MLFEIFEVQSSVLADLLLFGEFKQGVILFTSELVGNSVLFNVLFHILHRPFLWCFKCIRFTNLIPKILQYVDDGRISFTPAVALSYLNEQEQYDLLEQMEINDCTPSLSQACRFKKISY